MGVQRLVSYVLEMFVEEFSQSLISRVYIPLLEGVFHHPLSLIMLSCSVS